jgi:hypothetical protein
MHVLIDSNFRTILLMNVGQVSVSCCDRMLTDEDEAPDDAT